MISKQRVLLDAEGNCVSADDPSGVQVLAGFKGADIPEKTLRLAKAKGFKKFFEGPPERESEKRDDAALSKRVVPEPEPIHAKPVHVKK